MKVGQLRQAQLQVLNELLEEKEFLQELWQIKQHEVATNFWASPNFA